MTLRKTNSTEKPSITAAKKLLNWGALSEHLTGGNDRIRKNRLPKVHREKINLLIKYISLWIEDKEMISPVELEEKISQIDLKTIILGEK